MLAAVVCLAGCAGSSGNSSGNFVATNGAGTNAPGYAGTNTPGYNADGSPSSSTATPVAFASTGATHSTAASQAADALTAVAKPGASYRIGPLDVLEVSVFKVPDLAKTVQVAEDGTINYPLIGEVQASGKTSKELEQDLTRKLGSKYLRDPQVMVLVREFNSQRVTISGSVKSSGVYAVKGRTSLMQLVAMAGDIDTSTDSGTIVVFRVIDGQRTAARFDIDAIKSGNAEDPQVEPGDVIVVDSSATKTALSNVLKVLPLATTAMVFSGI